MQLKRYKIVIVRYGGRDSNQEIFTFLEHENC